MLLVVSGLQPHFLSAIRAIGEKIEADVFQVLGVNDYVAGDEGLLVLILLCLTHEYSLGDMASRAGVAATRHHVTRCFF